ncbi:thiosulfate oxidation carrier protein SoxY [Thiofilum flexile]|uniref:thiosulfate oxidation carrier protein SoxY n=1 Tax=Thiofilum flexile TaxID=125627 RepID=UPI0003650B50|nr:thiosulfate oxidation carrier protein SoxY [Thiofilum flexile]
MKRRTFLGNTLALATTGAALSTGLLAPQWAAAAGEASAASEASPSPFNLKALDEVLKSLNATDAKTSDAIKIKAPEIAENGAVVPVSISTTLAGVSTISLVVSNNPNPLAATFTLLEGTSPDVTTRIKMAKTAEVIAIVQAADGVHIAKQNIKVTLGGCGG